MSTFAPSEWKHFAMRTIIGETFGATLDSSNDPHDKAFWRKACEVAGQVVNRRATRDRGGPIHNYIANGLRALRAAIRRQANPTVEQLEALETQIANALILNDGRRCEHCNERTDACVDMWVQRPPPITFAGTCIGDFRDHFWFWDAVARRFYEFDERAAFPLDVRIGFRKSANPRPHGLSIEMAISGECEFRDIKQSRRSVVTIDVAISSFDWASVAAIPYLLMHELICHAYQGCWTGSPRQLPEQACAFADGWLDGVAFRLLETMLGHTSPGAVTLPWTDQPTLAAWLRHGGRLHRARYEEGADRHQYKSGLLCGEEVIRFLQRVRSAMPEELQENCDAHWPERTAANIAKTLNAIRTDPTPEFDAAILRISTILASEGRLSDSGYDASGIRISLWEALHQFLLEPDLDTLRVALAEPRLQIYKARQHLQRRMRTPPRIGPRKGSPC